MLFFLFLFKGGSNFGGRCVQKVFFFLVLLICIFIICLSLVIIFVYFFTLFCIYISLKPYLMPICNLLSASGFFYTTFCHFISLSHSLPPKEYIQARLDNKSVPEMYLRNLHDLYCQTVKLCTELQRFNLGNDSQFLSKLTKSIFQRHLSSYIR